MATTDGLTLATTSAMLGRIGDWPSGGGIDHVASIGVMFSVVVGGAGVEGGGDGDGVLISISGSRAHPAPEISEKAKIRQRTELINFFIFIAYPILH